MAESRTALPVGASSTAADRTASFDDDAFDEDPLQRDGVGSADGFGQFVDKVSCNS